jgi:class 3 adenylate cyclase
MNLNATTLEQWLARHGVGHCSALFEKNDVDLRTLRLLDDDDLRELGLSFGHRKRIIKALEAERADQAADGTGERRHVVAMFCDMVGFTDVSRRLDPEEVQDLARRYGDLCTRHVERYDGYVHQRLGDGVLAIFGYPRYHEGEAERAIRAALEICEGIATLGEFQVRIGIASGIVAVSSDDPELVSSTLNLASRLQGAAAPGTVVISGAVRHLARQSFDVTALGELSLKGYDEPVRAYAVKGLRETVTRFDAATGQKPAPMVGRDADFDRLDTLWRQIVEMRTGRGVVVTGDAGIGKSRIVNALSETVAAQGGPVLTMQCSPYHANAAFYPLAQLAEQTFRADGWGPAERLEALERAVLAAGMPRDRTAFAAASLGLPYETRYGSIETAPRAARAETVGVLALVLATLGRNGLIVVEDLHWADPGTLEVLTALADLLPAVPTMLLVSHRQGEAPRWPAAARLENVRIAPLDESAGIALVEAIAGTNTISGALAREIVRRADGVPLFIEELTKALAARHVADAGKGDLLRAAVALPPSVPDTLRNLLLARLDQSRQAKRAAQVGALIGRSFRHDFVMALGLDAGERALDDLVDLELAYRTGEGSEAVYTFKHALVQDAAAESLLRGDRRRIHLRIGETLESGAWGGHDAPAEIARHYSEAGHPERAARHWQAAGEAALARFALPETIGHLRAGMAQVEKLPPSETRDALDLGLRARLGPLVVAQYGWGAGEIASVLEPARAIAGKLGRHDRLGPILNTLSIHYFSICDMPASLACAERLLEAGTSHGDGDLKIVGHRAASAAHYWMGELADALRHGDAVRKLYDPEAHWHLAQASNVDPYTGEGVYRGPILWLTGFPDRARQASDEKDANAARRAHPFDRALALTLGAQLFELMREPEALLKRTEEAEAVAAEHGMALISDIMARLSRGCAAIMLGEPRDGAAMLDEAITRFHATGHRVWLSYLRARQAEAMAECGAPRDALALLADSLRHYERSKERVHLPEVLRIRGGLHLHLGETEAAEADYRASLDLAARQGALAWELRTTISLARLMADRGQRAAARDRLVLVHDRFTEGFETPDLLEARALRDALA